MENTNPETAFFHLNAVYCFTETHKAYSNYHLITAEPPFIISEISYTHTPVYLSEPVPER